MAKEFIYKQLEKIKKRPKKHPVLTFFVGDLILIVLASYIAFLLRYDAIMTPERVTKFLVFSGVAIIVSTFIFYLFGMYKISWTYVSVTDLPTVLKSVVVAVIALIAILFFFRFQPFPEIPRSIMFIFGVLLILFSGGLRFAKRIYWQIFYDQEGAHKIQDDFKLPLTASALTGTQKPGNILITGGAGYIGSVLTRQLLNEGFCVKIIDNLLFGGKPIQELKANPKFDIIEGDMTDTKLMAKELYNIDAVVNLGGIVGEPACLVNQALAMKLNYLGTVYLARLCKSFGIRRFIQASTCSTYGKQENNDEPIKETGKLFPCDFYGEGKVYSERELFKLADENFNPTILRFSTVYGLSPRMRFDLVVNTLTKKAVLDKKIMIFGGNQWRPLVHVTDISRLICQILQTPLSKVGNQVFNVGNTQENYRISEVGDLIKELIPDIVVEHIPTTEDKRSYKVNFEKIKNHLGFETQMTVRKGIIEIRDALLNGLIPNPDNRMHYNHLA